MQNQNDNCQTKNDPEVIIKKVKNFYKNEQFLNSISFYSIKDGLILLLDTIFEDINNMQNNRKVGLSKGRYEKVIGVYQFFLNYLFENKINENILSFLNDVNFLVTNWFLNIEILDEDKDKKDEILNILRKTESMLNMNLTLRELLLLLKDEMNSIKKLRTHEIPAFKLSQHYLDVLNEG